MHLPIGEVALKGLVQTVKSPKGLSGICFPRGPPKGKFARQSLMTFHCLSDFGLQQLKGWGAPTVALGLVWGNSGFGLAQC